MQPKYRVFLFLFILGSWACFSSPIFIPDSYEIVHLAECIDQASATKCGQLSWNFRPVFPSLVLKPFLFFMDGLLALRVLCLASVAVALCAMSELTTDRYSPYEQLWPLMIFAASASFFSLFSLADARTLTLGLVFAGWVLVHKKKSNWHVFWGAMLLGLAIS